MPSTIARGVSVAHDPRRGRLAAQRVVDEAADRRTVAGAGETMREPPVLERIGGRPAARHDVVQDLDGGGEAGGGRHRQRASRMRTMKMIHMIVSTSAPMHEEHSPRRDTRLLVTWT